jgi:Short C-terminal domain
MFATAVAAAIKPLQLAAAPILCHAPYSHGVVEVHNYSYGTTSGYSTSLRCANAAHQEHGTSLFAVIGILWLYGWVAALLLRAAYYWTKFGITRGVDAYWRRRLPQPAPARPRQVATPRSLLGDAGASTPPLACVARVGPVVTRQRPDPVEQLARLAALHDRGVLSDDEFAAEKARSSPANGNLTPCPARVRGCARAQLDFVRSTGGGEGDSGRPPSD